MGMKKAPGCIITGFEVVIQVFDIRIVLRIFGFQKSSQNQKEVKLRPCFLFLLFNNTIPLRGGRKIYRHKRAFGCPWTCSAGQVCHLVQV